MNKPIIGIVACNREVEGEPAQIVKNRYVEGVRLYADAVPLLVPSLPSPDAAEAIMARLDAVLLTGSVSNVVPSVYGVDAPGRLPEDRQRDAMSAALIRAGIAAGKPVFGICRGLQEINVALGGTLTDQRDAATGGLAHHAPDHADLPAMFAHTHDVEVLHGTPLEALTGRRKLEVNSVHYQRIDRLGAGLTVNARAGDGVVEAISAIHGPVFAVQWHPEWHPEDRPHDMAFWGYLGAAARRD